MKLLTLLFLMSSYSFAEVKLRDIGVIGLMSHDLFTWDKSSEVNLENGRLDLSTIFDYENGNRWQKGGNPKNAENAPVWSITKRLVDLYADQLKIKDANSARKFTVKYFHKMVFESYFRLTGVRIPKLAINSPVTNTEQAVFRAMHDILPGKAKFIRGKLFPLKEFKLTNFLFAKLYLNAAELDQTIKYFDGEYDPEYLAITIPFSRKKVNLKEVDGDFIAKHSPYLQENMLAELKRVGTAEININEAYFIEHAQSLLAKAICSKENQWIESSIKCH